MTLALRYLSLLLVLLCPVAQAEPMVQVELLLFRHTDTPLIASQPPAHNWAEGSSTLVERNEIPLSMGEAAAKLIPEQGYSILLHKAWRQTMTAATATLAVKSGQAQFEFYPIQGRLNLSFGDQISVETDIWVNRFDELGRIVACEYLEQKFRVRPNEIRYVDHGSLGLLVKVNRL